MLKTPSVFMVSAETFGSPKCPKITLSYISWKKLTFFPFAPVYQLMNSTFDNWPLLGKRENILHYPTRRSWCMLGWAVSEQVFCSWFRWFFNNKWNPWHRCNFIASRTKLFALFWCIIHVDPYKFRVAIVSVTQNIGLLSFTKCLKLWGSPYRGVCLVAFYNFHFLKPKAL